MKEGTVKIENGIFHYITNPDYYKGAYFKTESFSVKVSDIKIIGILYTMDFDDELDVLVFFNKYGYVGSIPVFNDLEEGQLNILVDFFNLNEYFFRDLNPNFLEDLKESYYEKGKSFVIYPRGMEGTILYKWNIFLSIIMLIPWLFKLKAYANRQLTKENKSFLVN